MLTHRSTWMGGTERSAIAPKKRGDSNAATADAPNAKGVQAPNPQACRTVPIGTNQAASAMPCRNNIAMSSNRWIHGKGCSTEFPFPGMEESFALRDLLFAVTLQAEGCRLEARNG
jgi:hypothetical protein